MSFKITKISGIDDEQHSRLQTRTKQDSEDIVGLRSLNDQSGMKKAHILYGKINSMHARIEMMNTLRRQRIIKGILVKMRSQNREIYERWSDINGKLLVNYSKDKLKLVGNVKA